MRYGRVLQRCNCRDQAFSLRFPVRRKLGYIRAFISTWSLSLHHEEECNFAKDDTSTINARYRLACLRDWCVFFKARAFTIVQTLICRSLGASAERVSMGESGIISHTESSPESFCFEMKGQYGTHGNDKRRVVSRI